MQNRNTWSSERENCHGIWNTGSSDTDLLN